MIDVNQARTDSERRSTASQLIGTDRVWNVRFAEQADQEDFCSLRSSVTLKENIEHEAVLVHCPPEPVSNAVYRGADLIDQPPGFPVTSSFSKEGAELNAPLVDEWRPHGRLFTTMLTSMPRSRSSSCTSRYLSGKRWYNQMACWMMLIGNRWRWGVGSVIADHHTG